MREGVIGVFFFIVVMLVVFGAPIWFSAKSRPLGDMRYRWGTFLGGMGIVGGVVALAQAVTMLIEGQSVPGGLMALFTLVVFATAIGVIRRNRWAAVLFITIQAILVAGSVLIAKPEDLPEPSRAFSSLAWVLINAGYFARRWRVMGLMASIGDEETEAVEQQGEVPE